MVAAELPISASENPWTSRQKIKSRQEKAEEKVTSLILFDRTQGVAQPF